MSRPPGQQSLNGEDGAVLRRVHRDAAVGVGDHLRRRIGIAEGQSAAESMGWGLGSFGSFGAARAARG